MSQLIDYNMVLTFFVTLAMWAAVAWIQDGRPWQRVVFYIALAFTFPTKGPVGMAIVSLGVSQFAVPRQAASSVATNLVMAAGFMLFPIVHLLVCRGRV